MKLTQSLAAFQAPLKQSIRAPEKLIFQTNN